MFEKIDNKYRPVPFWSWNEKLDAEETKRQIAMMDKAGIGGFFMHARGGLKTEYMGEEWFENVSASVDEAKKRNMHAWAYDENGWPSGFGNGVVNGVGVEFQQKFLRFEEGERQTENTICNKDGIHFYYEVNPFYVDVLNGEATRKFIAEIYEPYYERYKNDIDGFFTDEPQVSRGGIPWSFLLVDTYKEKYGEDLLGHLLELFRPVGDYENTRVKFWKMVTDMFSENFCKKIYNWCDERGLKFTGHLLAEETLFGQLHASGSAMSHYEYFHIPGMDWLGRNIDRCLTPLQVSSVAHQLGKKQVLSETFALCGHNVGHDELKGILEWQMVNGITLLCQHLEGYSLRGIRKRDYPPAMYYQQPWWDDYKTFNDSMSRIGMILSEGRVCYDTLLIHPQTSAWICFDADKNEGLEELNNSLIDTMQKLEEKHILYHFGDETIMERHAKVEGKELVIGTQKYKTVVLPPHKSLFDNTKRLLEEFESNGGKIVTADELEADLIVSSEKINYTKRSFDSFDVYYFVNSSAETIEAEIAVGAKVMDIKTGELSEFDGKHTFGAWGSLVIVDDGSERTESTAKILKTLDLSGAWNIADLTENSITLDRCDYYFDDELIEKNGYVLNIQQRACDLGRTVDIRQEYTLNAEYVPQNLCLVCETPEKFDIKINGATIDKEPCGYFADKSFKKLDISKHIKCGENKIVFLTRFVQSDEVYENLKKAVIFESEKNKLTYDLEIEPIYIVGDFSVKCDSGFEELERNALRYKGGFSIDKPKTELYLKNIEQQGYPFFAGTITLEKEFDLDSIDYKLDFVKKGVNVVKIKVNDGKEQVILWEPFSADLSRDLKVGKNKIQITLTNNLRNLLGPHHLEVGESYFVTPACFFKEDCIWMGWGKGEWNEDYCFVEVSIN